MSIKSQSEIIESLFSNRKVEDLEEYLENNSHLNITSLTDSQGNNVLHQLAYEGHFQLIRVFVRRAILKLRRSSQIQPHNKDSARKEIKQWLNQRNHEGFTPLLYASFCGHLQIIRFFVEDHHVDYSIKTSTGLNIFHVAAQKNVVMPFLYFRGKLNLYQLDSLNSTPLHWASYTNSQEVVSYILSETQDLSLLNIRDAEGNTPLLLAVTYGNTRVVRRLLIKGANRYIQNNEGKIPLDIAKESGFRTITKMLDQQFSILDLVKFYCNIKIEYKPKKKKYTIPILFIISFILNLFIINIFLQFTQDYVLYSQISFMAILFCFYLSLLCNRPTNEPRNMRSLLVEQSERTIKKVCFICKNKIPKRGYHCDTCGVCIEQYDHHCTWINNCVGKKNIARFIIFVVMLVISLAFIGSVAVLATIALVLNNPQHFEQLFTFRYAYKTNLERFSMVGCFTVNEITAVFTFPVTLLCIVQIRNLLTNKTTFQKSKGPSEETQLIKSKYSRAGKVSLRNCRVMCAESRGSFGSFTSTNASKASFSQLITQKYTSQRLESGESIHH